MRYKQGSNVPQQARKAFADGRGIGPSHARALPPLARGSAIVVCLSLMLTATSCDPTLDAGRNEQQGQLPVDQHNPVIIDNDTANDNWAGEFAVLLANNGGPTVVGIVVDANSYWSDLNENLTGWKKFVAAARASGLKHVPDVTEGASTPLTVPADQKIDSTVQLGSVGAQLIVDLSRRLSLPGQPLVVVTGAQLTNLADAYLMDPTVVDRVVVVAALGIYNSPKGNMTGPNGDLDPWADWIVAQRFHYIQISILYDQTSDVTTDDITNLPKNSFGDWMAAKLPNLSSLTTAADQTAVLAAGLPSFVTKVETSAPDLSAGFNSPPGQGPPLLPSATGNASLVTEGATSLLRTQLWQWLRNTFGAS